MAQTFTGRKRVRKVFGHVKEVGEMPNLIEVQKASYDQFLIMQAPKGGRANEGLQSVFKSVFPISDFAQTAQLEFVKYEYEAPKYDVDECRQRGMTYAAPLKVTLRLIVFDVDPETQARSVKDIKEQDVYMGDMPLMTDNGTFVVNGTERVIVSQMHRSPGVFFDHDKGKSHSSGKLLFAARIIPYRGSWLDIEFDAKDIVHARIDRRRKIPVTSLLYALGLDGEEILSTFYRKAVYTRDKQGWRVPYDPDRMKGVKVATDLVDADTGEVVVEAGRKLTVRSARQLVEKGLKAVRASDADLVGQYIAEDLYNAQTGEIFAEAGDEITEKLLALFVEKGFEEIPILEIDHINVGPYIRNTLKVDKNSSREDALFDIYRVMRPGEPPTLDSAEAMFNSLFFDSERYDLSAVGRVKMNMRLDLDAADTVRVLRKEDILAVVKALVDLRDGRGDIDDIDHLGNRRVRSVGELMENQYRVGLLRMERAIKERMSSVEIDTIMPQDLINAKPAAAAVREFFGSSQLSQFMDQTNPLSEITHKRRLSALGPGGLTRERAGFEVRDVHPTHYGRICPIETPEGPNIGLINSLATFARVNKYGFIESPYRKIRDGKVTDEVSYLSAMEEQKYSVAQADTPIDADGHLVGDLIVCRQAGDVVFLPGDRVDYMDVSPKQLVSVAAALIPFLENDDANRALMGSNMQRQAVPLVRSDAPLVGTGMEAIVARDSGAAIAARRAGVIDQIDATRIVIRATDETDATKPAVDIYRLMKFQRSNQSTCINQKPLVRVGDRVEKGDIIADGPSTDLGDLALGRNVLVAFMPWNGYNFEDSILLSERIVKDDVFTSIHIEEFEAMARDTKLGPEEITRDIPNVSEEALKNLDEAGIVYIGADVVAGDILVGKITPKGESPMTPEEKLLRAIFGEKASDVRDTSLRVPPGVQGTIVEVRVFNRHGVEKDERAQAIEREEIERLAKDRDDEQAILDRNVYARLADILIGKRALSGPKGFKKDQILTRALIDDHPRSQWWTFALESDPIDDRNRGDAEAVRRVEEVAGKPLPRQGREAAARRRIAAGRDEDGQGLHRREAQDPAGRQDGRTSWQQGRRLAHHPAGRHAVPRRRDAGRHRAQPARRAEPHERRPDPGDASGLGLRGAGQAGRRSGRRLSQGDGRQAVARQARADLRRQRDDQGTRRQGPRRTRRQSAPRRSDRDARVRRRAREGHRRNAEDGELRSVRAGHPVRRPHRRRLRPQGDRRIHLYAQASPSRRRQDPCALDRTLQPRHPAAAGRQGAVRRPAFRRNGGLGAGSLRRGVYLAGNAHRQVGRRGGPHQGLRSDRAWRRHVRVGNSRELQRAREGNAFARPQRRTGLHEEAAGRRVADRGGRVTAALALDLARASFAV